MLHDFFNLVTTNLNTIFEYTIRINTHFLYYFTLIHYIISIYVPILRQSICLIGHWYNSLYYKSTTYISLININTNFISLFKINYNICVLLYCVTENKTCTFEQYFHSNTCSHQCSSSENNYLRHSTSCFYISYPCFTPTCTSTIPPF